MSLYQGIQKILKNSVEGRVLYVCFQWLLLGHMTQPNALIERIYIYIYNTHTLIALSTAVPGIMVFSYAMHVQA